MRSIMTFKSCALLILSLAALSATAFADNRTLSGAFNGNESTMAATPDSCDSTPKKFAVAGTIQVSVSGSYRFVDLGNDFTYETPQGSIADVHIMVYQGSFDANSPLANRVGIATIYDNIVLNSGTDYILVVQHHCEEIVGAFGILINGTGSITGAGFATPAYMMGEFPTGGPTAFFGGNLGSEAAYATSGPVSFPNSGNYYYIDIGWRLDNAYMALRVYENSFNPLDTEQNLAYDLPIAATAQVPLEAGKSYVFVAISWLGNVGPWQFALFPPGNVGFNKGLAAAWATPGVQAAGILMDVFPQVGLVFFAWFTYPDQLIAQTTNIESAGGETQPQTHLGSEDQVWITGAGRIPEDGGQFMNISYENATGGAFNSPTPEGTIDSNYGSGWIDLISCTRFDLHFDLPGGLTGTVPMHRLLNDGVAYCQSHIKAGPIVQP